MLLATSLLCALAGCGIDVPSTSVGTVSEAGPRPTSPIAPPSIAASPTPDPDKREALLNALRQAGEPVSEDGELEARAASVACTMIDRGMTPEQLTTAVTARFAIPAPRARKLVDTVIATYC